MNLSFAGCGFLGIYHVGVACCFKKYAPHLLLDKISGASAGAIAACALLCDLSIGEITSDVLRVIQEARSGTLGPFTPSFNVQNALLEGLEKVLPKDAHVRVSGKLHISLTRVYDGKNVIVSQFKSRDELLQALLASAFIPIFSGLLPPKFNGTRYMDGGLSDNLPVLDENTVTVSPFCGESDICPRDPSSPQLFHVNVANTSIELSKQNIYRLMRILYPPNPETLSNMCKQGFDDALRFLHRNNLINCTRCLAVQSTFVVCESLDESVEYDPECSECKLHRQEALVANVPDAVMKAFQDAIESANKGLINWIFKYRGMKLLSILTLPYMLTADIIYAVFSKVLSCAPLLGNNIQAVSKLMLKTLSKVVQRMEKRGKQLSANVIYHLALTQYGADYGFDMEGVDNTPTNQLFCNFTVDLDSKLDNPVKILGNKILSRRSSLVLHKSELEQGDDTYGEIFKVTSQHEAVMAYYYTDENNKVKVTEIFDVTEAESKAIFMNHDHLHSHKLYQETWTDDTDRNSSIGLSDTSVDDQIDPEHPGILSDPESEWGQIQPVPADHSKSPSFGGSDTRPESDQSSANVNDTKPVLSRRPSFVIISS